MSDQELIEAAKEIERRLLESGDPFSGDDYSEMQVVRWALKMAEEREGLLADSELYRRGYELIGACDISNYLARCEAAGRISNLEETPA